MNPPQEYSFEQAYGELELILEQLNSASVSLDDSLLLYEKADSFIRICQDKLTQAEQRIEKLLKRDNGELVVEQGTPLTERFSPPGS